MGASSSGVASQQHDTRGGPTLQPPVVVVMARDALALLRQCAEASSLRDNTGRSHALKEARSLLQSAREAEQQMLAAVIAIRLGAERCLTSSVKGTATDEEDIAL